MIGTGVVFNGDPLSSINRKKTLNRGGMLPPISKRKNLV